MFNFNGNDCLKIEDRILRIDVMSGREDNRQQIFTKAFAGEDYF